MRHEKKAEVAHSWPVWDEDRLPLGTCDTPDSQSVLGFARSSVHCPRLPLSASPLLWPSIEGSRCSPPTSSWPQGCSRCHQRVSSRPGREHGRLRAGTPCASTHRALHGAREARRCSRPRPPGDGAMGVDKRAVEAFKAEGKHHGATAKGQGRVGKRVS